METGAAADSPAVDFLVVGAGVAGLRAAVELAGHGDVLVVTKESLGESNTHYAQGGIAVAAEDGADVGLHLEDTVRAGDGLVYPPAAQVLVSQGPIRVAELIKWGTNFDEATDSEGRRLNGRFLRTREGAHSLARILHANGDATGAEISRALVVHARRQPRIRFAEWTQVTRLVTAERRVMGAELAGAGLAGAGSGQPVAAPLRMRARAVLVASGGAGQVYAETTNPAVATGDGIALAAEAGAELADMEFYQFHPTALALEGAPRFLLSEALRGEGAYLRNGRGERFMERYHPQLELAPRDVVARAIAREGAVEGEARPVYLDMRHVKNVDLHRRFPGISAFLARHGLDLACDLIPVRPAAHYLMGGIRTDLSGRTSIAGLYAAGEAACTGVHGANRLASNSLLEGLVFGARAAQAMLADALPLIRTESEMPQEAKPLSAAEEQHLEATIVRLRSAMWTHAGLLREESSLREGLARQAECDAALAGLAMGAKRGRRLSEARALSRVAEAILKSAVARTESRGAHFRSDYPRRDDQNFGRHSVLGANREVIFERW